MPLRILPPLLIILVTGLLASAEELSCTANTQIAGQEYDWTSLNVEKTVERTRETPPSTMIDSLLFNICKELERKEVPEGDQCPYGSRACLTKINRKDEQDRIVSVIPLATTEGLNPQTQSLTGDNKSGITVVLHGAAYPTNGGVDQSLKVNLLCSSEGAEPTFSSYANGEAEVEWRTPAACSKGGVDRPTDEIPAEPIVPSGSGLGWFFLLFFLSLGAYFAIGAYHNYTNYGASGWDLIPHRDFWRDVPFLLRDLGQHLLSAVRGGPSRGGYHAV